MIILLTLIAILINIYLFFFEKELLGSLDNYFYLTVAEIVLIFLVYLKTTLYPLKSLSWKIALFLTWSKNWKNKNNLFSNDIKFITNFLDKILDLIKDFKEELMSWRELKWEVQLAAEIQKQVLKEKLIDIPSFEFVAKTKSASEVGWDSYDIIKSEDNYYIYVGDATGHWVAAWFIMMMTNALVSAFSKIMINWAQILSNANSILKPRIKPNTLMTLLMLRWDEANKKMYMTGAGHENLIVYKKSQNKAYKIQSWWIALWMARDISKILKEVQLVVEPGDIMVMYTDWITEARNSNKQSWDDVMMFGIDRLIESVEKSQVKSPISICNQITMDLSKFMWYNHKQFDDITLIVLKYKDPTENEIFVETEISKEYLAEWNWK